ncbi:MAG: HdeD family acid-resistance protein [Hyphomicrobiaceae bacterium]
MAQTSPHPIEAGPSNAPPPPTTDSRGRGWSIAVGVLLILAGIFAIAFPFVSSIAATLMVGWILVFVGVIEIIHAFSARGWRGAFWYGLVGLIFVIGGGMLIAQPLAGTFSLTALLAAILIVEGVIEVIASFVMRDRRNWGWVLASGIIALIAGLAIVEQLPTSAFWVLGFLVGLNLIFSGFSYIMDPFDDVGAVSPPPTAR